MVRLCHLDHARRQRLFSFAKTSFGHLTFTLRGIPFKDAIQSGRTSDNLFADLKDLPREACLIPSSMPANGLEPLSACITSRCDATLTRLFSPSSFWHHCAPRGVCAVHPRQPLRIFCLRRSENSFHQNPISDGLLQWVLYNRRSYPSTRRTRVPHLLRALHEEHRPPRPPSYLVHTSGFAPSMYTLAATSSPIYRTGDRNFLSAST